MSHCANNLACFATALPESGELCADVRLVESAFSEHTGAMSFELAARRGTTADPALIDRAIGHKGNLHTTDRRPPDGEGDGGGRTQVAAAPEGRAERHADEAEACLLREGGQEAHCGRDWSYRSLPRPSSRIILTSMRHAMPMATNRPRQPCHDSVHELSLMHSFMTGLPTVGG